MVRGGPRGPRVDGGGPGLRCAVAQDVAPGRPTLSPPLAWFLVIYLASLVVMLVTAFWTVNPFTNNLEHQFTLTNFGALFDAPIPAIIGRTVLIAALVTVTDAVIALPFAYFMARIATPAGAQRPFRRSAAAAVGEYLARVYTWIIILTKDGTLDWTTQQLGLGSPNIAYTNLAMYIVFSYIWLPFMILPVYGALERIPDSFIEASADLGARNWRTLRSVVLPLALPGVVAGSIFTFSLTLGDYITPLLIGSGSGTNLIGNVIYDNIGLANNLPFAAALAFVPIAIMSVYLLGAGRSARSRRCRWKGARDPSRTRRVGARRTGLPISADHDNRHIRVRPLQRSELADPEFTTHWFLVAWDDPAVRSALWLSVKAGIAATILALVLGSAAAFGVHRFRFFGRDAVSLFLVLPIALPGIITGLALRSFFTFDGINLSLVTIIIGHTTFCIVVVYNNVISRLRRTSGSLGEASMDLGAHGLQTFRYVTLPTIATALVSGALLAFGLSFDEVIVTTFTAGAQTTLPIWIFGQIRLGQQLPEVNVVVTVVLVLTVIPVALAARLTGGGGMTRSTVQ